ncbi:hypothetical protein ACJX0J_033354, partial [Zea mays]
MPCDLDLDDEDLDDGAEHELSKKELKKRELAELDAGSEETASAGPDEEDTTAVDAFTTYCCLITCKLYNTIIYNYYDYEKLSKAICAIKTLDWIGLDPYSLFSPFIHAHYYAINYFKFHNIGTCFHGKVHPNIHT